MSDQERASNPMPTNSGMPRRLAIIIGVFVVAATGIWGYQQYLKSTLPKKDMKFAKELDKNAEPVPEPTGLEVLSEMFRAPGPSKEVLELQKLTADEVAYTYDAIMKMSPEELEKNITELSARLLEKRKNLPPSFGAGSFSAPEGEGGDKDTSTVLSLALPLEVMQQVAAGKK